jgi:hypothetical protein
MEYIVISLLALNVAWSVYAGWVNHRQACDLRRAMEMLSARSFGEFAAGKAKLDGKTPAPSDWDPNF